MNLPAIVQRRRALRWLAPAGVLCVAGLAATGMFRANATSDTALPNTTPAALLAAVQGVQVAGFSGTVLSQMSLGLPEVPSVGGDTADGTSFTSLLSGSHTLQVWYGGVDKQRVALLGSTDETDVFRDGRDVWEWSSADHVAQHATLPAGRHTEPTPLPVSPSSLTPPQVAQHLLGTLDPSTEVTVGGNDEVADRAAYQLVLTPRTAATTIGSVRIAVDGATKLPLAVRVYPRNDSAAAIDVAFTTIHFSKQANRNFVFTPPPGATVKQSGSASASSTPVPASTAPAEQQPVRHSTGSGWSTVVGARLGAQQVAKLQHGPMSKALSPVSGTWGSGKLLESALVNVLVTSDGRLYAGAVNPSGLYAAAGLK